jgi:hypothetical protein
MASSFAPGVFKKPSKRRRNRSAAPIVRSVRSYTAVAAAILAVSLASCSATVHTAQRPPATSPAPITSAEPKDLAAAKAAAQEKSDRHSSGDFAGEWLLFTKDLRDHIMQQDFVQWSQTCSRSRATV